jgi:hypothetical protein
MLIKAKTKKFWSPSFLTQPGGKAVTGPLVTFVGSALPNTGSVTTSIDVPITFPAVASNTLLIVSVHIQNAPTITGIIFDPAGANTALTIESGVGTVAPVIASGLISAFGGGSRNIRVTTAASIAFFGMGLVCWLVTSQTQNFAVAAARATSGVGNNINVVAGEVIVNSAFDGSNRAYDWATSTALPSALHGAGTPLGAAEWAFNVTSTSSWTLIPLAGVAVVFGYVAATYK